jgi:hypothetical protein
MLRKRLEGFKVMYGICGPMEGRSGREVAIAAGRIQCGGVDWAGNMMLMTCSLRFPKAFTASSSVGQDETPGPEFQSSL